LVAELSRLIDWQAIAQAMQHRTQGLVSAASTGPQFLLDLLEPCIGLMKTSSPVKLMRMPSRLDAGEPGTVRRVLSLSKFCADGPAPP
jgi:hypothetical protein